MRADIRGFAIGQLARQNGHARALALLHFLAGARAGLRLLDDEIRELLAVLDVLVEPQLERRTRERRHQLHRVTAIQALLDLPLKLRIEHLRRQHERDARKHVFREQLDALRLQIVQLDKTLDRLEQTVAQTGFVRAARRRRNQVDVGLARERTLFAPGHHPRRALAFREGFFVRARVLGVAFAFEERNQQIAAVHAFEQIAAQTVFVLPGLAFAGFLVDERDFDARQQHRFRAQQTLQFAERQVRRIEVFRIGPRGDARAGLLLAFGGGAHLRAVWPHRRWQSPVRRPCRRARR